MKIGILTQPLYTNYGGIIQCYALQQTLKSLGHETVVLQREFNRQYTFSGGCIYYAKHIVKMLMGRRESWHYAVAQEKRDYIAQNTYKFIDRYIAPKSGHCYTTEQLRQEVARLNLDAIIVGSDQVWRPDYSPCQPNYFLDFLPADSHIKRISYAASFGGDNWTFSPEMTAQCGELLRRFNAVSVREQSGIRLCRDHFNVEAVQVLDPTMLLDSEDYIAISGEPQNRGNLFCYVLDNTPAKQAIINQIATQTGKQPFHSMPALPPDTYNLYGDIDRCIYPPVEHWLSAFREAEMVVTDSFHGTVFSIIFNRPFFVIANEGRGLARFQTLLKMFGLENRLITSTDIDTSSTIDWDAVNAKRQQLKQNSIDFIKTSLMKNN